MSDIISDWDHLNEKSSLRTIIEQLNEDMSNNDIDYSKIMNQTSSIFIKGLETILNSWFLDNGVHNRKDDLNIFSENLCEKTIEAWHEFSQILERSSDILVGYLPEDVIFDETEFDFSYTERDIYAFSVDQVLYAMNELDSNDLLHSSYSRDTKSVDALVHYIIGIVQNELTELDLSFAEEVVNLLSSIADDIDKLLLSESLIALEDNRKPSYISNKVTSELMKKKESETFINQMQDKTLVLLKMQYVELDQKLLLQNLRIQALNIAFQSWKKQELFLLTRLFLCFDAQDLRNDLIKIGIIHNASGLQSTLEWVIALTSDSIPYVKAPRVCILSNEGTNSTESNSAIHFQKLMLREIASISNNCPFWIHQAGLANDQIDGGWRINIHLCSDILNRMNLLSMEIIELESSYKCSVVQKECPVDEIHLFVTMAVPNKEVNVQFIFSSNDLRCVYLLCPSQVIIHTSDSHQSENNVGLQFSFHEISLKVNGYLYSASYPSLKLICSMISDFLQHV